jgi:adenylate kinase
MRFYIERKGRPYNYLPSVDDLNLERDEHLKVEEQERALKLKTEKEQAEGELSKQRKYLEELADKRLVEIMKHMKDLENCDKLNMRQFLMKFIIPVLTEGMIEVCKVGPIDPVDYLAEYIFKRSTEFRDQ